MNITDFNELVLQSLDEAIEVLTKKGVVYSTHKDRLSNFRKAGLLQNETPEKALFGMMAKHIVALSDFIEYLENGTDVPINEWYEKIGDIINYLLLLKALIKERYGK